MSQGRREGVCMGGCTWIYDRWREKERNLRKQDMMMHGAWREKQKREQRLRDGSEEREAWASEAEGRAGVVRGETDGPSAEGRLD